MRLGPTRIAPGRCPGNRAIDTVPSGLAPTGVRSGGLEDELHDEVVEWLGGLGEADWNRAVVVIDRLALLG